MKIRFNLTRSDLFKLRTAALMSSRPLLAVLLLIAVFCAYSGFTAESVAGKAVAHKVCSAIFETLIVLGIGFFGGMLLNVLQCLTTKGRGVLGEHTLEIADEGLIETTEYNTSLHRWSGFHKLKQSHGFLWIYVTDTKAHVVPLRRPLLEGNLSILLDQLRSKVKLPNELA